MWQKQLTNIEVAGSQSGVSKETFLPFYSSYCDLLQSCSRGDTEESHWQDMSLILGYVFLHDGVMLNVEIFAEVKD